MFSDYPDILNVTELAELLRVSITQAYRILRRGDIKAYKEGKDWKIPKETVREYILRRCN